MKFKKINDTYIIRLEKEEKLMQSIKNFCLKNNVRCGYFTGIGSCDEAELGAYLLKAKKYNFEYFKQPLEIANLTGNITTLNGNIHVHCHATLSDINMEAIAGHLKEAVISATCEIFLVKLDEEVSRKYDEDIGLNLMDP